MLLSGNYREVMAQLLTLAAHIEDASDEALQRVTEIEEHSIGRFIGAIYQRPANGWTRTGNLLRGLTHRRLNNESNEVYVGGPAEVYAQYRNDLNRPGRDGVLRYNPFFEQGPEAVEPQVQPVFDQAFEEALQKYLR